jgi:SAM-dependent methyltransferase
MRIIIPNSIQRYADQTRFDRLGRPHPYVEGGLTDEYVELCEALRAAVAPLGRRAGIALDLGAGDGTLTGQLLDTVARVIAVDDDARALRWAERVVGKSNVVKLDALRFLELTENSFDLIMMSHLLYYFREAQWSFILEAAARRLAPGGTLILCLWSANCDAAGIFRKISLRRGEQLYGEHAIDIAISRGFRVTQKRTIKAQHWFPSCRTPELADFFSLGALDDSQCPAEVLRDFLSADSYTFAQHDLLIVLTK